MLFLFVCFGYHLLRFWVIPTGDQGSGDLVLWDHAFPGDLGFLGSNSGQSPICQASYLNLCIFFLAYHVAPPTQEIAREKPSFWSQIWFWKKKKNCHVPVCMIWGLRQNTKDPKEELFLKIVKGSILSPQCKWLKIKKMEVFFPQPNSWHWEMGK